MIPIEPSHIAPKVPILGKPLEPPPLSARNLTQISIDHQTPKVNTKNAFQQVLRELETKLPEIKEKFLTAESLEPEEAHDLKSCSDAMIETIVLKLQSGETVFNLEESALSMIDTALHKSCKMIKSPLDFLLIPLTGIDSSTLSGTLSQAQLGLNASRILSKGALFLYHHILIQSAKKQLEQLKKSNLPNDQKKAEILEQWLSKQKSLAFDFTAANVLYFLKNISKGTWSIVNKIQLQGAIAKTGFLGFTSLVTLITDCYAVVKAEKDSHDQKKWLRRYDQKPIEQLLQKRKEAYKEKIELHRESFYAWLDQLIENDSLEQIQRALKDKGVQLSKNIKTKHEIINIKEELLHQYVKHKETIKSSLLNPLRTFAKQKHLQERKFLNFNRITSKIKLSLSTVISAVTITLKILVIVGIVTASAIALPLLITSGVGIAAGLILLIVGMIYLYRKKPNLCKTYLQGIQAKLAFSVLPKYFFEFRHNKAKLDRISNQIKLSSTSVQLIQIQMKLKQKELSEKDIKKLEIKRDEIKKSLEGLNKEKENIMKKITYLNEKYQYWDMKAKALKNKIEEAKLKDFIRKTGVTESLLETAANAITSHTQEWDQKTLNILKEELNIDLETIQSQKMNTNDIFQALKDFFSFDEKQLLAFIKTKPQRVSS